MAFPATPLGAFSQMVLESTAPSAVTWRVTEDESEDVTELNRSTDGQVDRTEAIFFSVGGITVDKARTIQQDTQVYPLKSTVFDIHLFNGSSSVTSGISCFPGH